MAPLTQHKLELLAPAGSLESFFAAIEAGADAVFCGLKEFSARSKAKNFSLEEMGRLTSYAHKQGRHLYVTLNTLIKDQELPHLIDVLGTLASFNVDGLIIQDLGLWHLAHTHFPKLPLHASTQMTVHNSAGVKMLEKMGFARAVLARELSLHEIAAIRRQTTMELEHFIHGALCYSISGHCLFSSYMDGKSGNRGRCVQPCRRRYSSRNKSGFYFSTSDFSALDLVPQLAEAGVMSFKIEGRMKNAEYVSTVVTAYRQVLDAHPKEKKQAIKKARKVLDQALGRRATIGFLRGHAPADIASPSQKGGIGKQLGEIEKVQGSAVSFTTADVVHVGDRLRIQPISDLAGTAFTVKELFLGKRKVKRAGTGSVVRIPTPFRDRFQVGDQAYKVATGKAFTLSEQACQRRLAAAHLPPESVELTISCKENTLCLEATATGEDFRYEYEVKMELARHSPLNKKTLESIFTQTGHGNLTLSRLTVGTLPPVVIKPSRLKEIRRHFYEQISGPIAAKKDDQMRLQREAITASLSVAKPRQQAVHNTFSVIASHYRDLADLNNPDIHNFILPLNQEFLQTKDKQQQQQLNHHKERIIWDIPAIIFENEWPFFQSLVTQLTSQGFTRFRLNNIGHFQLFTTRDKLTLSCGPWLYVLNSQALLALKKLGASAFSLSLEDDRRNMREIVARQSNMHSSVIIYSPIALITSRIPMHHRSGHNLESDTGKQLRLDFSSGLTVAQAGQDFSLIGHLQELREMGCGDFVVDLSVVGMESKRGKRILQAIKDDEGLDDTTLFNFKRGLL